MEEARGAVTNLIDEDDEVSETLTKVDEKIAEAIEALDEIALRIK